MTMRPVLTRRRQRSPTLLLALALLLGAIHTAGCASSAALATLSPQARAAYTATGIIRALDLLRDTAVSANQTTPPLLDTATTRKIVIYHRSALLILHDAIVDNPVADVALAGGGSGAITTITPIHWQQAILTGLDELRHDLSDHQQQVLGPYITLAHVAIEEALTR